MNTGIKSSNQMTTSSTIHLSKQNKPERKKKKKNSNKKCWGNFKEMIKLQKEKLFLSHFKYSFSTKKKR
jgi:hypothetical protein